MKEVIPESSYISLYKGKQFHKKRKKRIKRVIAFDLDETLGSFADLYILWSILQDMCENHYPVDFNKLLDLYPEFLRYGILHVLEYLYEKKMLGQCEKIYIYTNNQCSVNWIKLISKYFDYKLSVKSSLFDKIIYAFKIDNKRVEPERTTHSKTYADFMKCTMIPNSAEICFIDNSYYSRMKNEKVYYIQPTSYRHSLDVNTIINRFLQSPLSLKVPCKKKGDLYPFIKLQFDIFSSPGTPRAKHDKLKLQEIDILVIQKMMFHVKEFFFVTNMKKYTKKNKLPIGRFTRKKYN
jgi:hypothetical protein